MSITKNEEGRDSVASLRTSSMQRITSEASTTTRVEVSSSYPQSPATRKLIRRLSFQDANRNIMESKYMGFLAIFIAIRVAMSTKTSNEDFSLTELILGGNHSFNTRTWMLVYFSVYLFILHRGRARRSLSSILEQLYSKCQQLFQSGTESSNGTQLKSSRTSTESLAQRMKRIGSQQRWGSFQASFKFEQGGADGHVSVLSATEPFVPTDVTSNMTLTDLTIVLRYAFNLPKDQMNLTDDSHNLSDTLKQVFRNLDSATGMSRGNDVEPARPSSPNADYGDADALRFCAAVRLYTECDLPIEREFASDSSQKTENSWLLIEDDDESSDSIPPVGDISFLSEMSFEVEPSDDKSFEKSKQKKKNPLEEFGEHIAAEMDKFGRHVFGEHIVTEMDKFGKHVEGEWKKFTGGIVKIFDKHQKKEKKSSKFRMSQSSLNQLKEQEESQDKENTTQVERFILDENSEDFISKEMVKDACQQVMTHLEVVNPVMEDLAEMVKELNMNDPTRV